MPVNWGAFTSLREFGITKGQVHNPRIPRPMMTFRVLIRKMAANITVSYSVPTTVLNASRGLSHFPFKIYRKVDIITIAV